MRTECSSNEDLRQKTQRYEAKNGWENTFDGCVKTITAPKTVRYRFDNQFENCKLMNQKFTKESLEEKMERVALRKQKILERKQERARKFMTPRQDGFKILDDLSNQVDKVAISELPKPSQFV